jgi:hypothetical protein
MPAHIAHLIHAEEALRSALGDEASAILDRWGSFFRLGAQGPDLFYHNQRTRPTALLYGVLIHREGFGRLMAALVREGRRHGGAASETAAYLLGFATHAALDRRAHPFINYFAGWVDPRQPETQRYHRCHIYLERVLDVLLLRLRRNTEIRRYAFLPQVNCGLELPYPLVKVLVKSLHQAYPRFRRKSRDRCRIENAYRDTIFFYQFTEPGRLFYRRLARARDRIRGQNRRRLALFHPLQIPEGIDFLNLQRREWLHPCHDRIRSAATFLELYEESLREAAAAVRAVHDSLREEVPVETLAETIGNASLDTGLEDGGRCTPRYCDPLPLPELIEGLYRRRL